MELIEEDLNILKKNTNLNEKDATELLKQCNGDVVEAILKFTGEDKCPANNSTNKELTGVQVKIQELKNILDKKDEIMDKLLENQKSKG